MLMSFLHLLTLEMSQSDKVYLKILDQTTRKVAYIIYDSIYIRQSTYYALRR